MGIVTVKEYGDLRGKIADPSLWPEGPEGDAARQAFLAGMDAATVRVQDTTQRLEAAKKWAGTVLGVLKKIPELAGLVT